MKIYIKILRLTHQLFCSLPLLFATLDAGIIRNVPQAVILFAIGHLLASTAGFAVNDYVDSFDTDQLSPDNRPTKGKTLKPKIALTIVSVLTLLALCFYALSGSIGLFAGVITLALMHAYSVPPIRLKRFAFLEAIVQFIAWLLIPYFAIFIISGTVLPSNLISLLPFIFLTLFLTSAASVNSIIDIEADRQSGIFNTTAHWGFEKSIKAAAYLLIAALCVGFALVYFHLSPWYYLMFLPGLKALQAYGRALGNTDRPKEIEKYFLQVKKKGKLWGFILFGSLVIFLIVQWQLKIF